jgi:hypothetical protein
MQERVWEERIPKMARDVDALIRLRMLGDPEPWVTLYL